MSLERQDILPTLAVIGSVQRFYAAYAHVCPSEEIKERLRSVEAEQTRLRALYDSCEVGVREQFTIDHPPRYDQLDGIYDCGGEHCPRTGFKDAEDRELHHLMWGIELKKRGPG